MAPVKTPDDVFLIATQNLVGAVNGQTNIPYLFIIVRLNHAH